MLVIARDQMIYIWTRRWNVLTDQLNGLQVEDLRPLELWLGPYGLLLLRVTTRFQLHEPHLCRYGEVADALKNDLVL